MSVSADSETSIWKASGMIKACPLRGMSAVKAALHGCSLGQSQALHSVYNSTAHACKAAEVYSPFGAEAWAEPHGSLRASGK